MVLKPIKHSCSVLGRGREKKENKKYTRLFALSGNIVRNKLCWDADDTVGLSKQKTLINRARLSFVLKVPLRYLLLSMI